MSNNWNEVLGPKGPTFPVLGRKFNLRDTYGREWAAQYTAGTNFDICVNGRWQSPDPALRYTHWQYADHEAEGEGEGEDDVLAPFPPM